MFLDLGISRKEVSRKKISTLNSELNVVVNGVYRHGDEYHKSASRTQALLLSGKFGRLLTVKSQGCRNQESLPSIHYLNPQR